MTFSPLQSGDTVGVFSPASYVEQGELDEGISFLKESGFKVFVHPQTYLQHNQSAGSHEDKLQALHELYENDDIKAIIATSGGNRALHLLPHINFELSKKYSKPLIGYSDVTSLLNALWVKTGQVNLHAPILKYLKNNKNGKSLIDFLRVGKLEYTLEDATAFRQGEAHGTLLGGNLSVFHHMIGTEFFPDMSRAILLIEDINEESSRLDRTLCHLEQTGMFKEINGLIIGSMENIQDTGLKSFGFTLEEIIKEHTENYDFPIILNAPFGHGNENLCLPIGTNVKILVSKQKIGIST